MCIHVCAGFGNYSPGASGWTAFLFWGSLSRAGVPLFLMCSGALMLDPEKDPGLKKLWSKNILRLFAALFFWAFCYGLFHLFRTGNLNAPSLVGLLKDVLFFRHEQHMYYLHIMLLVYAFLPVTRAFAARAERSQLLYFLCIWFLLGIVFPTL
ncbi:MAG TPA: acyltransferase family protein, partial [Bacillota bacterium]|nr:acyltransferase family protein [Bacillota bacterium]